MRSTIYLSASLYALSGMAWLIYLLTDCEGNWFDDPELSACVLLNAPINPEAVKSLYFFGPLLLIPLTFVALLGGAGCLIQYFLKSTQRSENGE